MCLALQRHFFSPPSLGAYDVRDTLGDCAVAPRPRRRGAPQSYTHAGVTRLQITGGAATPSALALFFPKRPFKCHRKKCANIVSNIWCCQPAYFRTSYCAIPSSVLPSSNHCSTAHRIPLSQTKVRRGVLTGALLV